MATGRKRSVIAHREHAGYSLPRVLRAVEVSSELMNILLALIKSDLLRRPSPETYFVFFAAAAFALAAFFLLLLIMTIERKDPTIVDASSVRMTGILIAQTRGGKRPCKLCSSSTKGLRR
jgi:hypothetical protein